MMSIEEDEKELDMMEDCRTTMSYIWFQTSHLAHWTLVGCWNRRLNDCVYVWMFLSKLARLARLAKIPSTNTPDYFMLFYGLALSAEAEGLIANLGLEQVLKYSQSSHGGWQQAQLFRPEPQFLSLTSLGLIRDR